MVALPLVYVLLYYGDLIVNVHLLLENHPFGRVCVYVCGGRWGSNHLSLSSEEKTGGGAAHNRG